MPSPAEAVDSALSELERLRKLIKKSNSPQVRSVDECGLAKATASVWFTGHRPAIGAAATDDDLHLIDDNYRVILEASERHSARKRYLTVLTDLKNLLIELRTQLISARNTQPTNDKSPDFSPLISDAGMQRILEGRWHECVLCLSAGAALAATVMMGGLLEALLLARINREANKAPIFTAKSAPKSAKTASTKPLGEWMLNDFIQVLSELKWITVSATAVGAVLREYRNYIHPQKQLSHNLHLTSEDAALFWEITKNITRQVIASAP